MGHQYAESLWKIRFLLDDPIKYFWREHNLGRAEHRRMTAVVTENIGYKALAYREGVAKVTVRNSIRHGRLKLGLDCTDIRIRMLNELRRLANESLGPS
jgi:hypothetical protein